MRRDKYIRHSAFLLVLLMMTLLVTKSLHVYSHSIQTLNAYTHNSCCTSNSNSHDDDNEGHKHAGHKCLICDFVVSPFLEGKLTEYSFVLSVVHYSFQITLIEDVKSEILIHKASRAPPAHILS